MGTPILWMTSGGCEVDVGGEGSTFVLDFIINIQDPGGCNGGEVHVQITYCTSSLSPPTIARAPDIHKIDSTGLHQ